MADNTGWTAWSAGAGGGINEDPNEQQTGSGTDDLAAGGGFSGMESQTGLLGASDAMFFRATFTRYSGSENDWGNGGNLGVGMDLDADGAMDVIMMISQNSNGSTTEIKWGTPGSDLNDRPSTTDWTLNAASTAALTLYNGSNGSSADFFYTSTGSNQFNAATGGTDNADAWLSFAVTYSDFQAAIRANAVSGFGSYVFDANSAISYVVFTSQQDNAFNQDLLGAPKISTLASTDTFTSLGAITPPTTASGAVAPVPEPATYLQVGAFMLTGLGLFIWKRRASRGASSASNG